MKSQKVFVRRKELNDLRLESEGDIRDYLSPIGHKTEVKIPSKYVGPAQIFKNKVKEACVMFQTPTKSPGKQKRLMKTESREERKLDNHREMERYWGKVEKLLTKKTRRDSGRLCSNQVYQYRAKREKLMAVNKPAAEMYKNYYWQMSLRARKKPTSEIYLSLGSDGLYTKMQYSISKPDHISKPDFKSLNNTENIANSPMDSLLCVAGESKLKREQDALRKVGYNQLDLNALVRDKYPEETIFEDYDPKNSLH